MYSPYLFNLYDTAPMLWCGFKPFHLNCLCLRRRGGGTLTCSRKNYNRTVCGLVTYKCTRSKREYIIIFEGTFFRGPWRPCGTTIIPNVGSPYKAKRWLFWALTTRFHLFVCRKWGMISLFFVRSEIMLSVCVQYLSVIELIHRTGQNDSTMIRYGPIKSIAIPITKGTHRMTIMFQVLCIVE